MGSIICLVDTIQQKEFRYNYVKNKKNFSEFFPAFLKSVLNFKHLPKKDDPHSLCISGKTGSGKYG